ncbi:hypothetical protein [Nonomuraea rubra]|uniref:Putative subunit of tRNA(5-methylaminomethyl-2-thiouridylate) methyltransferase n=1 Tax=Nonomuraea rubra TaxID=46180 RepID=A0A7X0P872_9ACTN|nr:hypothetical protein [Nonomuraea rubra]MBB6556851.1 putative subunit of tRNA(5-methylaminomethyl-2-thiouridylate) methyltransferase [Nonomuraea rubra]
MEPFGKTDYESEARKALQKGDVSTAQVWATLYQAQVLGRRLEKIEEAVHAIALKP